MTIKEKKKMLRKQTKAKVSALPARYCERADHKICEYVIQFPEYHTAETIFCYVGTIDEINTVPIIIDALNCGKTVGIPKCVDKGVMCVYHVKTLESLKLGAYGILEPSDDAKMITPEEIDLALIPCMTCGTDGKRLGYGGGYYDRYLEHTKFPKVVLCRGKLMTENIPVDQHDQIMDYVISEKGTISIVNRM